MIAYSELPILIQNTVCFWAMLLCGFALLNGILLFKQRRAALLATVTLLFLIAYFYLHVCREMTQWHLYGQIHKVAVVWGRQPSALFFMILALVTMALTVMFFHIRKWSREHITDMSIKESMDGLPAGICYYTEEGRCILTNHRMKEICQELTGHALQNALELYGRVQKQKVITLTDGSAITFRHRELVYEGNRLYELIADDITTLHEKSELLREKNDRARQLGESMKAYGCTIDDTVRRQEILQAKINIHDEMNQLILATQRQLSTSAKEEERETLMQAWLRQMMLLGREADEYTTHPGVADLNTLSERLGIRLVWENALYTEKDEVWELVTYVVREAMINAVKHGGASLLHIQMLQENESFHLRLKNNGRVPGAPPKETGGLANLRRKIEEEGGRMEVQCAPEFVLDVCIPKGEVSYAISSTDR